MHRSAERINIVHDFSPLVWRECQPVVSPTSCPTSIHRKIDNCGRLPREACASVSSDRWQSRLTADWCQSPREGRVPYSAISRCGKVLRFRAHSSPGFCGGARRESGPRELAAGALRTESRSRSICGESAPRHQGGGHLATGVGVDRCLGSGGCRSVRRHGCTSRCHRTVRRRVDGGLDRRRGEFG